MAVEYPFVRRVRLPLTPDADPNTVVLAEGDIFRQQPRPHFGPTARGGATLAHALYFTFEDAAGHDLAGTGVIRFSGWEQDGATRGWVQIQDPSVTLKQRVKVIGRAVQEAALFFQVLAVSGVPAGAAWLVMHACEVATDTDATYGLGTADNPMVVAVTIAPSEMVRSARAGSNLEYRSGSGNEELLYQESIDFAMLAPSIITMRATLTALTKQSSGAGLYFIRVGGTEGLADGDIWAVLTTTNAAYLAVPDTVTGAHKPRPVGAQTVKLTAASAGPGILAFAKAFELLFTE